MFDRKCLFWIVISFLFVIAASSSSVYSFPSSPSFSQPAMSPADYDYFNLSLSLEPRTTHSWLLNVTRGLYYLELKTSGYYHIRAQTSAEVFIDKTNECLEAFSFNESDVLNITVTSKESTKIIYLTGFFAGPGSLVFGHEDLDYFITNIDLNFHVSDWFLSNASLSIEVFNVETNQSITSAYLGYYNDLDEIVLDEPGEYYFVVKVSGGFLFQSSVTTFFVSDPFTVIANQPITYQFSDLPALLYENDQILLNLTANDPEGFPIEDPIMIITRIQDGQVFFLYLPFNNYSVSFWSLLFNASVLPVGIFNYSIALYTVDPSHDEVKITGVIERSNSSVYTITKITVEEPFHESSNNSGEETTVVTTANTTNTTFSFPLFSIISAVVLTWLVRKRRN